MEQATPTPAKPLEAKQTPETQKGKNSSEAKASFPLSLVISIVGTLTFFIGILVLINLIPTKAGEVQKMRSEVMAVKMSTQDQALLLQAITDTEKERALLTAAFPNEESLLEFIAIIDKLKMSEVRVVRFTVDSDHPTKIGKNPSFLPMTLVLRGTQEQVEQALRVITDSPYLIKPVTFTQTYEPEGGQVGVQTQFHLYVSDVFTKTKSQ